MSAKKHHETSHLCTSKRNPNDFCPNTEQLRQGRLSQRQSISLVGNPVVDASQSANPQQPAPPTWHVNNLTYPLHIPNMSKSSNLCATACGHSWTLPCWANTRAGHSTGSKWCPSHGTCSSGFLSHHVGLARFFSYKHFKLKWTKWTLEHGVLQTLTEQVRLPTSPSRAHHGGTMWSMKWAMPDLRHSLPSKRQGRCWNLLVSKTGIIPAKVINPLLIGRARPVLWFATHVQVLTISTETSHINNQEEDIG